MKQSINIQVPVIPKQHYDVIIGEGLLFQLPDLLPADLLHNKFVIITDTKVKDLYGKAAIEAFKDKGIAAELIAFPTGERYKNATTKSHLESTLFKKHYGRDTCIIALGGGVVGDVAGFVAATYMRGLPLVHVPTTLLAMVDSSIGGKTGINKPEGKNLIGAFWHPRTVIMDLHCLKTLPKKEMISGWVEALKIFAMCDAYILQEACETNEPNMRFIKRAIELKADIVARDPQEKNARAICNFGHTIGHALEKVAKYKLMHGHAVAYGMLIESQIALQRGLVTKHDLDIFCNALHALGFRGKYLQKFNINSILKATRTDKKAKGQKVRYTLLKDLGNVYVHGGEYAHEVTDEEVKKAWNAVSNGEHHARK